MFKLNCQAWLVIFGTLVAILLRSATTLHPYSGQETPPMYGDYEAQRHWMEITTNLPVNQWYHNTTDNNLEYWGLDYPPLTAYHMYVCGYIASLINGNFTKLHDSRGYESDGHKLFMRYTVLIADVALYLPALMFYFISTRKLYSDKNKLEKKNQKTKIEKPLPTSLSIILALLYPGVILIDHGHFQYNCISLAFFIIAVTCLLSKHNIIASVVFCLALNYKQMELYHALPFFFYLLSTCVPKPCQSTVSGIVRLVKIGLAVILTFLVIWSPFLFSIDDLIQVLHRQFPVARGVFEDKVSNLWCALNIVFKFRQRFCNYDMMRICLFTTLTAIFPSSVDLFLRPNLRKFVLASINSSLAFFLFSFQVHEKTILLAAIPVVLYLPQAPFVCFWFLCISVFSMLPLLMKDGLMVAVVALQLFYVTAFRACIEHAHRTVLNVSDGLLEYYRSLIHTLLDIEYAKSTQLDLIKATYRQVVRNREALKTLVFHFVLLLSLVGCLLITVVTLSVKPPARYPDLFPLVISVYSFVHFLGFFVYFNVKQIGIPQEFDEVRNLKIKQS